MFTTSSAGAAGCKINNLLENALFSSSLTQKASLRHFWSRSLAEVCKNWYFRAGRPSHKSVLYIYLSFLKAIAKCVSYLLSSQCRCDFVSGIFCYLLAGSFSLCLLPFRPPHHNINWKSAARREEWRVKWRNDLKSRKEFCTEGCFGMRGINI